MTEDKYDRIMYHAEKTYKKWMKAEDPYAFHRAFEYAQREIEEDLTLDREMVDAHKDDISKCFIYGHTLVELNKTELAVCLIMLNNIASDSRNKINKLINMWRT